MDQLRHAEFHEGLQMIGAGAFSYCGSLERITVPSSVTYIGYEAFQHCTGLAEVTLCEGVHYIGTGAFNQCVSLQRINIPPVALVIDFEGSSYQFMSETMPVGWGRTLVVSKWMHNRSSDQLAQAEAKVNEILGSPLQIDEEKFERIKEWFAYCYLLDVTTMLELGIWRCNMDGNEPDAEARQASRRNCGSDMNIVIPGVLEYLEG